MSLDHILLGLLCERPASGYDLKGEFDTGARLFWNAELSQIYPVLKRLEKDGLLRSQSGDSRRGPRRRVYEVTESGRSELNRWLCEEPHVHQDRFAYVAQIAFMGEADGLSRTEKFLIDIRAVWRARLAAIRLLEPASDHSGQYNDRDFHYAAALKLGVRQLEAKLTWADETLRAVRARRRAAMSDEPATRSNTGRTDRIQTA